MTRLFFYAGYYNNVSCDRRNNRLYSYLGVQKTHIRQNVYPARDILNPLTTIEILTLLHIPAKKNIASYVPTLPYTEEGGFVVESTTEEMEVDRGGARPGPSPGPLSRDDGLAGPIHLQ